MNQGPSMNILKILGHKKIFERRDISSCSYLFGRSLEPKKKETPYPLFKLCKKVQPQLTCPK